MCKLNERLGTEQTGTDGTIEHDCTLIAREGRGKGSCDDNDDGDGDSLSRIDLS